MNRFFEKASAKIREGSLTALIRSQIEHHFKLTSKQLRLERSFRVSLGDRDINDEEFKYVTASQVTDHPNYDTNTEDFDFSIITLRNPVNFNEKIQPVCLPGTTTNDYAKEVGIVSGWKAFRDVHRISNIAKQLWVAETHVMTNEICQRIYDATDKMDKIRITDSMLCAWPKGKFACEVNSGGPMTIKENNR